MREFGCVKCIYSYNGLIDLLLKSRFCTEALEVYSRMILEGFKPSLLQTYSSFMVGLGKRRDIKSVMGLLKEMATLGLKPNVYTFTICIRVLGLVITNNRNLDSVKQFWSKMEKTGHVHDVATFTIFVDALCKAGNFGEAFDTLDVMRDQGIILNLHTYNTLICGLLRVHRLDDALEIFGNMEFLGIKPTAYTYIVFIDYYGKSGDYVSALKTLEKMKTKGKAPNMPVTRL